MAFKRWRVIQWLCLFFQCANKKYVKNTKISITFASNEYTITQTIPYKKELKLWNISILQSQTVVTKNTNINLIADQMNFRMIFNRSNQKSVINIQILIIKLKNVILLFKLFLFYWCNWNYFKYKLTEELKKN